MEILLASDDGLVGMRFSFQGRRDGETTGEVSCLLPFLLQVSISTWGNWVGRGAEGVTMAISGECGCCGQKADASCGCSQLATLS